MYWGHRYLEAFPSYCATIVRVNLIRQFGETFYYLLHLHKNSRLGMI